MQLNSHKLEKKMLNGEEQVSNAKIDCELNQNKGVVKSAMVLLDVPKTMSGQEWIQVPIHERFEPDRSLH